MFQVVAKLHYLQRHAVVKDSLADIPTAFFSLSQNKYDLA